ncbi:MAG: insulinase family protein [Bacteroidetes bacterium]|nr:insulinase family protein [Bacteroidota bacterium]
MRTFGIYLCLGLLVVGCRTQQLGQQAYPHLASGLQPLEGAPIQAVVKQQPSGVVAVHWIIRGGVASGRLQPGAEALMLKALFRCGAGRVAGPDFERQMARLGMRVQTAAGPDYSVIRMQCPARQFAAAWDLMLEAMLFPDFEPNSYLKLRDEWAATVQQEQQAQHWQWQHAAFQRYWGPSHPYVATLPTGWYDSLAVLPLAAVQEAYKQLLRANRLRLLVVGPVDASWLAAQLQQQLSGLPEAELPRAPEAASPGEDQVWIAEAEKTTRCLIGAMLPAPLPGTREWPAMLLATHALGQALQADQCQQRFLSCEAFAHCLPHGLVYVGVESEHAYASTQAFVQLLNLYRSQGFTEAELADAKAVYLGELFRELEGNAATAEWLAAALARGHLASQASLPDQIAALQLEEVNRVFQKYARALLWQYQGQMGQVNERAFKLARPK